MLTGLHQGSLCLSFTTSSGAGPWMVSPPLHSCLWWPFFNSLYFIFLSSFGTSTFICLLHWISISSPIGRPVWGWKKPKGWECVSFSQDTRNWLYSHSVLTFCFVKGPINAGQRLIWCVTCLVFLQFTCDIGEGWQGGSSWVSWS